MMQLTLDARRLEAQRPADLLTDALKWIDENEAAWSLLVEWARNDAAAYRRTRVKRYIEDLRTLRLPWATATVKLPNAYSAAFTRILAVWYPDLEPFIPKASSKLDGCSIPPRPDWAA